MAEAAEAGAVPGTELVDKVLGRGGTPSGDQCFSVLQVMCVVGHDGMFVEITLD